MRKECEIKRTQAVAVTWKKLRIKGLTGLPSELVSSSENDYREDWSISIATN
jgi:hypothetical protein